MKWKLTLSAFAAAAAIAAAAAAATTERTGEAIVPVSQVIGKIEARPDFAKLSAVHYDTRHDDYEVLYKAKDGSAKALVIDAANGREIDDAELREASAAAPGAGIK